MAFKFENLEVWKLSLDYCDQIYDIVDLLPSKEEYNLRTQIRRAVTSISLNIAEGSTSQSDPEFSRIPRNGYQIVHGGNRLPAFSQKKKVR